MMFFLLELMIKIKCAEFLKFSDIYKQIGHEGMPSLQGLSSLHGRFSGSKIVIQDNFDLEFSSCGPQKSLFSIRKAFPAD
jgi:hypothetical protein